MAWRVRVRHDAAGTTLTLPEGGETLVSRLKTLAAEALNIQVRRDSARAAEEHDNDDEKKESEEEEDGLLVLRGYPLQEVSACPPAQTSEAPAATKVRQLEKYAWKACTRHCVLRACLSSIQEMTRLVDRAQSRVSE